MRSLTQKLPPPLVSKSWAYSVLPCIYSLICLFFKGNIRPHVISLLFRSLVSVPVRAVVAAHDALRDVLALSMSCRERGDTDGHQKSQSRLPKELLQTCIRPVLLNLRDHSRLSISLLRGLARLLSLLSTWFNRTLGEKLLDHLQKWADPSRIVALKIWKEGDEPLIAAAIVDIFSLLPHASHFVEPLVKTCIKLDASLAHPSYKARFPLPPFLLPLARYLNRHVQQSVDFFFQRLKSPMYGELFQNIIRLDESSSLRTHLGSKQCSVMILNYCFERPLAIIRSEKTTGSGKAALFMHGLVSQLSTTEVQDDLNQPKPMNVESLEHQLGGLRIIETLLKADADYFNDHSDIVRAFRWLWRSKGRLLRLQSEDKISPRYHGESKMLASFLMSFGKSFPNEGLDILFELIRVFLQPSSVDFTFVRTYLNEMVTIVLTHEQKRHVMLRFFALIAGESSEDTKVFSIQHVVFPMLFHHFAATVTTTAAEVELEGKKCVQLPLLDAGAVFKFVHEGLLQKSIVASNGNRLRVELLRLSNLFLEFTPALMEPLKKEVVKHCWGLLKSEDSTCRGWAYVVVCRVVSAFETPAKIVLQVYSALLRSHQQEGRDLIRAALDILLPALPKRLMLDDCQKAIDQANKILMEEGHLILQLAHISHIVVRNPSFYYASCTRFASYMINTLSRLGLPPNCPPENRSLSVGIVELILDWNDQSKDVQRLLSKEQIDNLANFLVRLKVLMTEPLDARSLHVSNASLDNKTTKLLKRMVSQWNCEIKAQPFEKVLVRERQPVGQLLACMEVFCVLSEAHRLDLFSTCPTTISRVVRMCFSNIMNDERLKNNLRKFVHGTASLPCMHYSFMVSLEKAVVDAHHELKMNSTNTDGGNRHLRTKDRLSAAESSAVIMENVLFCIELIRGLCLAQKDTLHYVTSSLLGLASYLTKSHLIEAALKQKHSSTLSPRIASAGMKHHTPTSGIFEFSCIGDLVDQSRPVSSKSKSSNDELPTPLKCLLIILTIFESSDLLYSLTQNRKSMLQILGNIMDTSDSIQLLMMATRTVGKWLLLDNPAPFTTSERNSFLAKMISFDFTGLPDDVVAQPLCDVVGHFVEQFSQLKGCAALSDIESDCYVDRSVISCLLLPNEQLRERILKLFLNGDNEQKARVSTECHVHFLLHKLFLSNFEALGGRFWAIVFIDSLLCTGYSDHPEVIVSLRTLAHADVVTAQQLLEEILPHCWSLVPDDDKRLQLTRSIECLLSKPFHAQFLKHEAGTSPPHVENGVRSILATINKLRPTPAIDTHLLVCLAENYSAWFEVLTLLERQYSTSQISPNEALLSPMRHCYRKLNEQDVFLYLAGITCRMGLSKRALSLDLHNKVSQAIECYEDLISLVEAGNTPIEPSPFEMDSWEERWIRLQNELCQLDVVSDFAKASEDPYLELECAWKSQDWSRVRSLCTSTELLAAAESGDPLVKISETLLAVADGKLSDVENLHAQTAQLCLYKWQLLPRMASGSPSHTSLMHLFHRLVEIRESGQIMVETSSHSNKRTLPDLKNLLNAWRYRLPNDCESMAHWDEIFSWRAHMFNAITSNFSSVDPNTLASLHDRPWTAIRMAKTARKHGMREVSVVLLNKAVEERAMNVSDAFFKLREQVLTYYNLESDLERHGGLNLINATNVSFFDSSQKSELFRLKAQFLASLGSRSKANQAYCHAVQINPS
jgi:hypothetical protein